MAEYIEREAAIESVKKERNYTGKFTFEEEHAWAVGFQQGITFALSDIAAIPAADVRPVVKAHWTDHRTIEHDGEWYCTACGKEITIYMGADRKDRYKFCPNCGARMEGS